MAGQVFFGKRRLCYTDVSDFTDFQGIGRDPMYKRYDSVFSIVKKVIPSELQHFFATPQYNEDEDQISWHIDIWNERPEKLTDLQGAEAERYNAILDTTAEAYKSAIMRLDGEDLQIMANAIKYISADCVYCADGKVFLVAWGMTLNTKQHKEIGSVIHEFDYVKKFKITFDGGEHGIVPKLNSIIRRAEGTPLAATDLPMVDVAEGWRFTGWSPEAIGTKVTSDLTFTAQYEKVQPQVPPAPAPEVKIIPTEFFNCHFDAGEHGVIEGTADILKEDGTCIEAHEIPTVKPKNGFKFTGWSAEPLNHHVDGNVCFTARYEEVIPWYRRLWMALCALFSAKGCLKWLLWILLAIFLTWLLSWLFDSCSGHRSPWRHGYSNGVVAPSPIDIGNGRIVDDNGFVHPIPIDNGTLPGGGHVVAPVFGEGGSDAPIIEQPGTPNTIANRLFLFLEDENDDIEALAVAFKKVYSDDRYSIIGFDREVKSLIVQVPENERDHIRNTINAQIPDHRFIVFDEEIYELRGRRTTEAASNPGWHIKAINLQAGWGITKGSSAVRVAVVDDGIDATHPMFSGRIVDAYNVFRQDNTLSPGEHGTHTAGLAAGGIDRLSQGAAGVAPNCEIMPIQVFDNGRCPLSALVSGVMYAVHHDADVVNISIGPSFDGLNILPVEQQKQIAAAQFKNVEKLWARVCSLAAKKRCILVFAAGNDDIISSVPPNNRTQSAIVVAAVDEKLYPTDFTNYGPCSDISAPGSDIVSAAPGGGVQPMDGTSMAAPIVTGTIALMKSLKKDLTVEQARNALYKSGADVYGYIPPMVLVDEALKCVQRGDFAKPAERPYRPVPDSADDDTPVRRGAPDTTTPPDDNGIDFDAIRRKIKEYKEKISELEKLLPQN